MSVTQTTTQDQSSHTLAALMTSNNLETWKLLHAVGGAEVVFEGAVAVHGHVEVEFGHKCEQGTRAVRVLDGANTHPQEPVHVQHLILHTQISVQ